MTKVWASVQGGMGEKPSHVDKGHFLSFCERSRREKASIKVDGGKFLVPFPKF